jgi:hypothetical protein
MNDDDEADKNHDDSVPAAALLRSNGELRDAPRRYHRLAQAAGGDARIKVDLEGGNLYQASENRGAVPAPAVSG